MDSFVPFGRSGKFMASGVACSTFMLNFSKVACFGLADFFSVVFECAFSLLLEGFDSFLDF
jgi:hypothetical protein